MLVRLCEECVGGDAVREKRKKHFDYAFIASQFPFLFPGFRRVASLIGANYIVFHICYDFFIIDEDEHLNSSVAVVFFFKWN